MSFGLSRVAVLTLVVASSMAVSRAALACYVDSECNEGQVCQDYVCKNAAKQSANSASSSSSEGASSDGESRPAAATQSSAAGSDVKATVKAGTFGIDAAFPAGGGPSVGFGFFLDHNDALRFNVGLEWDFKPASAFQFSLEPTFRHYLGGTRLKPFIEPGLYLSYTGGSSGPIDFAITLGLGAEFFIWNMLSIGASVGVGLQFNALNESGAAAATEGQSIKLTTGTSAVFLAYYW